MAKEGYLKWGEEASLLNKPVLERTHIQSEPQKCPNGIGPWIYVLSAISPSPFMCFIKVTSLEAGKLHELSKPNSMSILFSYTLPVSN